MKHAVILISSIIMLMMLATGTVEGQYYTSGADPASIFWKQLKTKHFLFLYPREFQLHIGELAGFFERVYIPVSNSLGHQPDRITVLVHSHTATSNGMVVWAPKRIELFMNPHQSIYAEPWMMQLATHEFRHVVQMDKISDDLPGWTKALLGQQATALAVGAYLPYWFLEGDAVATETAFSETGRGRQPSFLMQEKAQIVSDSLYCYDKAVLGSYRDFVPDRYHFGYWLVAGIRNKYGAGVWSDMLDEIGKKPFSVTPFNHALHQKTGRTKEELYRELFREYRLLWTRKIQSLALSKQRVINPPVQGYTNYKYLQACPDGSVVGVKETRTDIDRIVQIWDGREKVLFTPGNIVDGSFSRTGNWLIWSEQQPDIRWANAEKTRIVCWNYITGQQKVFKKLGILAAPSINPEQTQFAVVATDAQNNYSLSIFSFKNGRLIRRYQLADHSYFISPCWDGNRQIYFIGLNRKGNYIGRLTIQDGKIKQLTSSSSSDLKDLVVSGGRLYFTSSSSGIDNIYSFDPALSTFRQLTSVRFGAAYPSLSKTNFYFSNYTANGYEVCCMNRDSTFHRKLSSLPTAAYPVADRLLQSEPDTFVLRQPATIDTSISRHYSRLAHLFHFHSYAPVYIDPEGYQLTPGVSFLSQNSLGTATTVLGYDYDLSEHTGTYRARFKYSGWWPVLSAEFSDGKQKRHYWTVVADNDRLGRTVRQDTLDLPYRWNEMKASLDVYLPLTFNDGKYNQYVQGRIKYEYTRINQDGANAAALYNGFYHSLHYQLYFQNQIHSAELDFAPDWEQTLQLDYKMSPSGGAELGHIAAAQSFLYFPGMASNEVWRIYNGYQKISQSGSFSFSDIVRTARGYSSIQNDQLYTFGIDYLAPLAYPDLTLGKLYYMKRLRGDLFYDYTRLNGAVLSAGSTIRSSYAYSLQSTGIELVAEGNLFRLPAPTSLGLRGIYRQSSHDLIVEVYFSVQFSGL